MRLLLLFIAVFPWSMSAQSTVDSSRIGLPRLLLKTDLASLINPAKGAAAVSADIRLAKDMSLELGAGYFFNSSTFAPTTSDSYTGLRLRLGLNYYLLQTEGMNLYFGFTGKYHNITNVRYQNIFRQGFAYNEIYPVKRKVETFGGGVRIGTSIFLGKRKRLVLEPYGGFGIAVHKVSNNLPPDAEFFRFREFFNWEYPPGESTWGDILFGVKFGVAIW